MADRLKSESVISFTPTTKSAASNDADQLEAAGQTILKSLRKAASVAEANSRHALEMAQELSHQLRAATDGSGRWRLRFSFTERSLNVLNSGCTMSTWRLRNGHPTAGRGAATDVPSIVIWSVIIFDNERRHKIR